MKKLVAAILATVISLSIFTATTSFAATSNTQITNTTVSPLLGPPDPM